MWKILHGVAPNNLGIKFVTGGRLGTRAELPSLVKGSQRSKQTAFDRSFAVMGSKLWNRLPAEFNTIVEFQAFKQQVSKFLASLPDRPPTTGYPATRNSIVDLNIGELHDKQAIPRLD